MNKLLILLMLGSCAAQQDQGGTFHLSDETIEKCENEGGCTLVSHEFLLELVKRALDTCGSRT